MKNSILFIALFTLNAIPLIGQLAISPTGNLPDSSAILDLQSNSKGLLIPRMSTSEVASISGPAVGLCVYDYTLQKFCYYSGTAWVYFPTDPTVIHDMDNDTKLETERLPDEDIIRLRLGGTDKITFRPNRIDILNNGNVAIGENAGMSTTAADNVVVGKDAGKTNTTGIGNVFVGRNAGQNNTTSAYNVFVGFGSGTSNTVGGGNTFLGGASGNANTTGNSNTYMGFNAGTQSTTASSNTAIGAWSFWRNTTGFSNTFLGNGTADANTTGAQNTGLGQNAMFGNTTGSRNTSLGHEALFTNTIGNDNVAIGQQALRANTTANDNVAIGKDAGKSTTTGNGNVFIGRNAGQNNTTSAFNVFVGQGSGFSNTIGGGNTYVGSAAGSGNSVGNSNTCMGFNAGTQATSSGNTIMGAWTGWRTTSGSNNTFLGGGSADMNTTGTENTFLGNSSGVANVSGSQNVYIGFRAGFNSTGSRNILLGRGAGESETGSDKLYIENSSASIPLIWGDFNVNRVGINMAATTNTLEVNGTASKATAGDWLANSDARLKKNIQPLDAEEIMQHLAELKGISYEWNDQKTGQTRPEGIQYGFTAQNVQAVFPELVETDNLGYLQTSYGTYDAMYVEVLKMLYLKITDLEKSNQELASKLESTMTLTASVSNNK